MVLQWILLGVFAGVLPLFFRVWKPDLFFPILKDIRLARILHYYVLFVLGAGLYKGRVPCTDKYECGTLF